ncbi:HTH_Tnp_Tc3_2 domain-containing protein [Trichonephila clavipes]|nr:HTH_Tnp_Tc3_2 domain-containing protein [Trichonephila clavipes]
MTSACDDKSLLRMAVNDRTASSRQLAAHWCTATDVLMSASSIHRRLLHRRLRAKMPLYRIPSRSTIDGCVCNRLMGPEPDRLIGTKSFHMNPVPICGTMIAAFVLDAMTVNAAFQNALSYDTVA